MTEEDPGHLLGATTRVAVAYFSRNAVALGQIPQIITDIHESLAGLGRSAPPAVQGPAVPIKRSVKQNELVCLECGRAFTMLKRHLRTDHQLTVLAYKAKWGLALDYPMVAPAYSRDLSAFAKRIGLGRKPGKTKTRAKRRSKQVVRGR